MKKLKEAGKITVGLDDSYPPMEFRDKENKLVGFDIDLGNEIGKKLGVKLNIQLQILMVYYWLLIQVNLMLLFQD